MRSAIIFLAIVAYVYGETLNLFLYEELPELYKEFIPEHVRKFFNILSTKEKILIREFATKTGDFSKKSDDQIWELLKTTNLELYKKADVERTWIEKKIKDLKPETKTFVEFLFEKLRLVWKNSDKEHLQEIAKQIVEKFKDLKEDYRLDLKTHFLRIYEYIQDSKFEELANGAFQFVDGEILNLFLYEELPELYKEFIPEHVRKFFTTLSIEEKILIREFAAKTGDFFKKSDDQVWELLKTKNLDLYKKAFEVRTLVEKKIDNLKPEAKTFIEFLFERLRLVYKNSDKQHLQETAKQIIGKFKDLKEDYRLDVKTHFIRIYEYIQDSKFEELAKGIFRFIDGEILNLFLYEELPELYKEFIPEKVRKFFITLSVEEKTLIREFATKTGDFSKKSDDEVWELLKTKNLELYKKVFEVRTFVEKKIEDLKPETKTFVELLFERLRLVYKNSDIQYLQETAKQIIGKFKDLKEDYRLDLKTHFLRIYEYIQDRKFEELAKGNLRFVDGEILNLFLYEKLPELYKEFIPEQVRKFFTTLSVEEKTLIREFATKTGDFSKKSDDEIWELLKTKNLKLYKKIFEVRTLVEKKIEDLKPETKTFVELLFERLRLVYKNSDKQHLQETAKQIIGKFKDLKEDYRLDLKSHFLRIYEYIQDSKFEELANGIRFE